MAIVGKINQIDVNDSQFAIDQSYLNLNDFLQNPNAYASKQSARGYVPTYFRTNGRAITYKLAQDNDYIWVSEQFIGSSWSTADADWQDLGPVKVSQNIETGHTDINIGSDSYPVASVEEVSQLTRTILGIDQTIEDEGVLKPICVLKLPSGSYPFRATIKIEVTTEDTGHYNIIQKTNGVETAIANNVQGNFVINKVCWYDEIYLYPYEESITASVRYTIVFGELTKTNEIVNNRGNKTDLICGIKAIQQSTVNYPNCIFNISDYNIPSGSNIHIKTIVDDAAIYNITYTRNNAETRIANPTGSYEFDFVLPDNVEKFTFYIYSGNPSGTIEYDIKGQWNDVKDIADTIVANNIVLYQGFKVTRGNGITMTDGGYIKPSTGQIISDPYYKYSDYVAVLANKQYKLHPGGRMFSTNQGVTFYDSDKNVIGYYVTNTIDYDRTFETPERCAYIRFSAYKDTTDESLTYIGESCAPWKEDIDKDLSSDIESLILPTKIYVNDKIPLDIYLRSMLPSYLRDSLVFVKNNTTYMNKLFTHAESYRVSIVDSSDVNEGTLGIIVKDKLFGKNDIVIVHGDVTTTRTIRYILFGDSTSASFMPSRILANLTNRGINNITLTPIGTAGGGYDKTEARSGWMYAQYIGYCTVLNDGTTPIAEFPSFLKLATSEDKVNHPDWCFTRTYTTREKTYQEVIAEGGDTSQDFYIFDFANYLSVNGFSTPDVVMMQMSINDLFVYGFNVDAYNICAKAITIMTTQISAVSSSIKIVVSPSPITVDNYKRFDWYARCKQVCETLQVDYLPIYMFQSLFMLPLQDNEGQLVPYDVHTTNEGYMAAAQAWANYLLV